MKIIGHSSINGWLIVTTMMHVILCRMTRILVVEDDQIMIVDLGREVSTIKHMIDIY